MSRYNPIAFAFSACTPRASEVAPREQSSASEYSSSARPRPRRRAERATASCSIHPRPWPSTPSRCYERHLRRRREADDSRGIWHDFERTRPLPEPERPPEVTELERTDVREEIAIADR